MPKRAVAAPPYSLWQNNTNSSWWKDKGLRTLSLLCLCLYFGVFAVGYDSSLLNGLQAMPTWNNYFGTPAGNTLGIIGMSSYLPGIAFAPIAAFTNDRFGRRMTILGGTCFTFLGVALGAAANGRGMFIAGRVIVGTGNTFNLLGSVCLVNEIVHPRLRHMTGALFFCCYYVGSIVAAWTTFGCLYWSSNWGWRLPQLMQALGAIVLVIGTLLISESPRWLVSKGRLAEAKAILSKYHANYSTQDQLVDMEFEEITSSIAEEQRHNTSWGALVATKGNRMRTLILVIISSGTQWNGVGIISYYLAPILRQLGIEQPAQIAGINGGLSIWNFITAVCGALVVERVGRRPLWITSTIGMLICYCLITGLSAGFAKHPTSGYGTAVIPFLYIYYGFYSIAWTPLSYSYSIEILPYSIRAKGMSLYTVVQFAALSLNQWANPVALQALQWKYYAIYIGVLAVYLVLVVLLFRETRGLSLEEVALLFDHKKNDDTGAILAHELHDDKGVNKDMMLEPHA